MAAAAGMESLSSLREVERRPNDAETNNNIKTGNAVSSSAAGVYGTSPKSEPLLPLTADLVADERRSKESEEKDRQLRETEERERQNRDLRAGLHPLQHRFVFWYTRRTPGNRSQTSYEDNMKRISEFSTVEDFWGCYCHLARAATLPNPTDFHLFKEGIRPLWEKLFILLVRVDAAFLVADGLIEAHASNYFRAPFNNEKDAANRNGGKWIIRFKKLVSGRFWEDLVLAIVGDQLEFGDTVCGAVLSIRFGEDILSIWNRNSSDNQAVMSLRDSIKRHLHLPHSYLMEYKPHDASLRDKSSFRNTWLRG